MEHDKSKNVIVGTVRVVLSSSSYQSAIGMLLFQSSVA